MEVEEKQKNADVSGEWLNVKMPCRRCGEPVGLDGFVCEECLRFLPSKNAMFQNPKTHGHICEACGGMSLGTKEWLEFGDWVLDGIHTCKNEDREYWRKDSEKRKEQWVAAKSFYSLPIKELEPLLSSLEI